MELLSGAGSWGCGSTWHGIVDGRVGCLDVALGVIDGGRVGGWEMGRSMHAVDASGVNEFDGGGALVAGGCSI